MPEPRAIRPATTRVWWRKSDDEGRISGVRAGCLSVEANLRSRLGRTQKPSARQRRVYGGGKAMSAFDPDCIFCKIVRVELLAIKAYEDEDVVAFPDIRLLAPMHLLVIPKLHVASLADRDMMHRDVLGQIMALARE